MLYKYEKACQEAGLSEETTAEIRKLFDADYKQMRREKAARSESGLGFFTIEQLAESSGDENCDFEISDGTDLEAMIIAKEDKRRLQIILSQLPEEDRSFLFVAFGGERGSQKVLAAELGITKDAFLHKKRKLLRFLRKEFLEETKE